MSITDEVKESLEREFNICSKSIRFYKRQIRRLEKKYSMNTSTFLKKFESGQAGDDPEFFDWYAFQKLLSSWTSTKKALLPFIK